MTISGPSPTLSGQEALGQIQIAVAVKAHNIAKDQAANVQQLLEGVAETAEQIQAQRGVDVTA